jgi:hypothetical protein
MTFVQFWKMAKAKGLKNKNPVDNPFMIKGTPSSHYSPERTFSLPLD